MNTVLSGFIGAANETPFVVIDTGDTASNMSEGLDVLNSLLVGTAINSTSVNTSTNAPVLDVPNPWVVSGKSALTEISMMYDLGIAIHVNGTTPTEVRIVGNGVNTVYSNGVRFPKMRTPVAGAIVFTINKTAIAGSTTYVDRVIFDSGVVRFVFRFSGFGNLYMQIHLDGSAFFFLDKPTGSIVIDKVGASSGQLNYIGELEPNKIYCLRPYVVSATGVVYNAAGGTAPNCSVMAFNRVNGRLVGKTKSGIDGIYSLQCIAKKGDELFIVCLDDDGVAPDFDAQIIDRVVV